MIKLSSQDRRILNELEKNARQPLTAIAKKVRSSKETTHYAVKRLENEGVIKGYSAIINTFNLGYTIFRILLRFDDVNEKTEKILMSKFKDIQNIGWIVNIDGNWNCVLLIWARNIFEFEKCYNQLLLISGEFIKDKRISPVTTIHHLKHNILYDKPDYSKIISGGQFKSTMTIDDLDKKIMRILANDARIPLIKIATQCKHNPNTIRYRINKLEKEKIISGYSVILDVSLLGYSHYKVILDLNVNSKESTASLISYLSQCKNVIFITQAFGLGDLEFEVLFLQSTELDTFMKSIKRQMPGVIRHHEVILTYLEENISYFPF